ncbi:MAG: glycosyltransferase family 4 protein [Nitrospirae bacterium]|nr:glycosyltransferase family 4 protein [Nitrospirota bacterium]
MKSDSLHFEDSPEVTRGSFKIALIRKNYTPYGGAENYLRLVAKGLKAEGYEIHVFSRDIYQNNDFIIHKINSPNKPSFLSNIFFAVNSRNALKKESFDCVLSFERIPFQDIYSVRKKALSKLSNGVYRAGDGCHREWLNKRKLIEPFFKNLSFFINPHHLTLLYLEKQCFLNSRIIIANSIMVKNDIIKHYNIPEDKIHVIYNGVDLNRFHPVSREESRNVKSSLGIKEDRVILFAGSDFKRKGLITLLRATSLLDMKDKRLIVVGKGNISYYLKKAKELRTDKHVTFWGSEKEIERLYGIADIFVLPTIYDPFSNATLEAMASGLPVVTTAYNGASELIEDRIQGFIVNDPLDAKTFANRISTTLNNAGEMGRNARIKAENFSIEKAVDEIIKMFKRII